MPDRSQDTNSTPAIERPSQDAIDREFLLGAVEHDEDLLRDLVAAFSLTYPQLLGKLRESIVAGAPKEIRAVVHQLEGMMASLGATNAVLILAEMGAAARDNNLALLPPLLDRVSGELARAKVNLDAILSKLLARAQGHR